jgi:hypothetical protein
MAIRVEHELHSRRRGRNWGLFAVLIAFVALVFGLTVVKVLSLDSIAQFQGYDHIVQPANLIPEPAAEPQQ